MASSGGGGGGGGGGASGAADDAVGSVWNAGSWHWEEKKYTPWAKIDIRQRLEGLSVEDGPVSVKVVDVSKLDVDASINVRKGKKIVGFEIDATCTWEGRLTDGSTSRVTRGELRVPELFPDDLTDDFDVLVTCSSSSGPGVDACKNAVKRKMVPELRAQIRAFAEALKSQDGGETAVRAEQAKREAEAAAAKTAAEKSAAEKARLEEEARQAEMKLKEAADKEAAAAPPRDPSTMKPPSSGSEWNAGGFHWEDKPLTPWARQRLATMVRGFDFDMPGGAFQIVELTTFKGDASISVRKGKKLIFFDFEIAAKWEGEVFDDEGEIIAQGDGELHIPELDQDTGAEAFEVTVRPCEDGGKDDARLSDLMRKHGIPEMRRLVAKFVEELKAK